MQRFIAILGFATLCLGGCADERGLAVVSISIPSGIEVGQEIEVRVTVRNRSFSYPTPATTLTFHDGRPHPTFLAQEATARKTPPGEPRPVRALQPLESETLVFKVKATDDLHVLFARVATDPSWDANSENDVRIRKFRPHGKWVQKWWWKELQGAADVNLKVLVVTYRRFLNLSLTDAQMDALEERVRGWAREVWKNTLCLKLHLEFVRIDRTLYPGLDTWPSWWDGKFNGWFVPLHVVKGDVPRAHRVCIVHLPQHESDPQGGALAYGWYDWPSGTFYQSQRIFANSAETFRNRTASLLDNYTHEFFHGLDWFYWWAKPTFPDPHWAESDAIKKAAEELREDHGAFTADDLLRSGTGEPKWGWIWGLETWPSQRWRSLLEWSKARTWETPHTSDDFEVPVTRWSSSINLRHTLPDTSAVSKLV